MSVYKGSNIKRFSGMVEHVVRDRSGRFTKDITKNIIQFQIGNGQTVLGTVLFTGQHICKIGSVTNQVTQLTNLR